MNTKLFTFLVLALFSTLGHQFSIARAQGTAFTYQGRFTQNGVPFTGNAKFQATIYSAAAIHELNEKVEVGSQRSEVRGRKLEEKLEQKETEITELKQRLVALEQIVRNLKSN